MRIDIITVFTGVIGEYTLHSILKRAQTKGILEVHVVNLRAFRLSKANRLTITNTEEEQAW
jgi:tRNA (guanine37-N1)-methyltransferase